MDYDRDINRAIKGTVNCIGDELGLSGDGINAIVRVPVWAILLAAAVVMLLILVSCCIGCCCGKSRSGAIIVQAPNPAYKELR